MRSLFNPKSSPNTGRIESEGEIFKSNKLKDSVTPAVVYSLAVGYSTQSLFTTMAAAITVYGTSVLCHSVTNESKLERKAYKGKSNGRAYYKALAARYAASAAVAFVTSTQADKIDNGADSVIKKLTSSNEVSFNSSANGRPSMKEMLAGNYTLPAAPAPAARLG